MANISLKIHGFKEYREKTKKRASSFASTLAKWARNEGTEIIYGSIANNFERQSSPEGIPWKPLAERTLLDRLYKGYGSQPILYRKGDLLKDMIGRGADKIEVNKESGKVVLSFNPKMEKAYKLNFGDSSKNLPAREFAGMSAEDLSEFYMSVHNLMTSFIKNG